MIRKAPKAVSEWLLFKDRDAPLLDRIAATRVRLSTVLGVAPAMPSADFSVAFAAPFVPGLVDFRPRRKGLEGWQRWVAVAERANLRLVSLAEVEQASATAARPRPLVVEDDEGQLRNAY